ncbi:hypothetical protein [Methanoregula sp.]|uniref:hypothetical protein n=1 Tax=Methanoregula sp. TaxID=2052170 RepID=UPI00356262F9
MTPNTEWKKVAASLITSGVFALICTLSYLFIDGMNGGFALAFIAFFLAVSSVAVSLLFLHRARVMDAILADPAPLAHWTYPETMARESAEREYLDYAERNRVMFIVIGGMLVAVALFFIIFMGEDGLATGITLIAFAGLLFIISRVAPCIERRRAMSSPHEAFISRSGIIYEGAVYPFRSFLMVQDRISFRKAKRNHPALIVFSFTQMAGSFIVQPFDVVIPVPIGEEENACRIAGELGGN